MNNIKGIIQEKFGQGSELLRLKTVLPYKTPWLPRVSVSDWTWEDELFHYYIRSFIERHLRL